MNFLAILVSIFGVVKASSPVILAVLSGLGMILTKTLGWGISEVFQALALVFGGVSVVGLRNAVAELSASVQSTQGPTAGSGTSPAAEAS